MRWTFAVLAVAAFPVTAHPQEVPDLFAGTVLAPDGNPVAGAQVWLTSEGWADTEGPSVLGETQTDGEGRFEFREFPPPPEEGLYAICAYREGWAFAFSRRTRRAAPNLLFVFEQEFPLRGRVLDPEGTPVSGIRPAVSFTYRLASFDPLQMEAYGGAVIAPPLAISDMMTSASNERGEFEVRHLPPGIELSLKVRDNRYAYTRVHFAWRDLSIGEPIELTLEPPGTIRGRVFRQEDGAPVPGLEVAAYGGGKVITDEQGRYEITNVHSGVHQICLHEVPTVFTAKALTDIALEPGETAEGMDLAVIPGVEITGTVTDQDTGEPLANAGVCCNTSQQPKVGIAWPVVHTNQNGRYSLRAPEGPAQLRPFGMPEGWRSAGDYGSQYKQFTVSGGRGPIEVNFWAVRAEWTVSGRVLGPDGEPAAYARVLVARETSVLGIGTSIADGSGRFAFENVKPDAQCALRAHLGEDMSLEDCVVEPGDDTPVTLQLAAGVRPTLTGRVVGEDGNPIAHALIRASCSGVPGTIPGAGGEQMVMDTGGARKWYALNCYGVADAQGGFSLRGLWPGMPQSLRISCGGYAERELPVAALQSGEERELGDISLAVADLVITGRVVDEQGTPVAGAAVGAERIRGMFGRSFVATTDLNGAFRFEGLPREEVLIAVNQFNYDSVPQRAGPDHTEVLVTAIPRKEQVLFRHELVPPLRGAAGAMRATISALYRFKGFDDRGEVGQYLGLDADVEREPGGRRPFFYVFDDTGQQLEESSAEARVEGYRMHAYELPEAGVTALSRIVITDRRLPEGGDLEFGELRLLEPGQAERGAAILWWLELTDDWIEPEDDQETAERGEPPYLSARIYAVATRDLSYEPVSAAALPDGPELVPKAVFRYDPAADTVDAPESLDRWEDQLREEAASALRTLRDWGAVTSADPIVVGCWFQSVGGHGEGALPEILKASLKAVPAAGGQALIFDEIPIPPELTRAVEL